MALDFSQHITTHLGFKADDHVTWGNGDASAQIDCFVVWEGVVHAICVLTKPLKRDGKTFKKGIWSDVPVTELRHIR